MYFRILHDESSGSASYLLADLEAGEAVLIDPHAADLAILRAMLDEHALRLRWILRTHEHDACAGDDLAALSTFDVPVVQHDTPAAAAGSLGFGREHLHVMATPGHTAGCLSFRWRDRLFCGGLLWPDTCPTAPHAADPQSLWHSVSKAVFSLPCETLLFAGHGHRGHIVSVVGEQRRWHPWFGRASRDEFLARLQRIPSAPPRNIPTFPTP